MPPTVTFFPFMSTVTATCLDLVSVVIIASAACVPASCVSASIDGSALIPATIVSIGSCIPITPVDATSTEFSGIPSALDTACASLRHALSPSSPVRALATPLLITTACEYSLLYTIFLSHFTGAANTLFVVNVPAVTHGFSEKIIAMSFFVLFLIPAFIPAALNPFAAVTPPCIISILINLLTLNLLRCIYIV